MPPTPFDNPAGTLAEISPANPLAEEAVLGHKKVMGGQGMQETQQAISSRDPADIPATKQPTATQTKTRPATPTRKLPPAPPARRTPTTKKAATIPDAQQTISTDNPAAKSPVVQGKTTARPAIPTRTLPPAPAQSVPTAPQIATSKVASPSTTQTTEFSIKEAITKAFDAAWQNQKQPAKPPIDETNKKAIIEHIAKTLQDENIPITQENIDKFAKIAVGLATADYLWNNKDEAQTNPWTDATYSSERGVTIYNQFTNKVKEIPLSSEAEIQAYIKGHLRTKWNELASGKPEEPLCSILEQQMIQTMVEEIQQSGLGVARSKVSKIIQNTVIYLLGKDEYFQTPLEEPKRQNLIKLLQEKFDRIHEAVSQKLLQATKREPTTEKDLKLHEEIVTAVKTALSQLKKQAPNVKLDDALCGRLANLAVTTTLYISIEECKKILQALVNLSTNLQKWENLPVGEQTINLVSEITGAIINDLVQKIATPAFATSEKQKQRETILDAVQHMLQQSFETIDVINKSLKEHRQLPISDDAKFKIAQEVATMFAIQPHELLGWKRALETAVQKKETMGRATDTSISDTNKHINSLKEQMPIMLHVFLNQAQPFEFTPDEILEMLPEFKKILADPNNGFSPEEKQKLDSLIKNMELMESPIKTLVSIGDTLTNLFSEKGARMLENTEFLSDQLNVIKANLDKALAISSLPPEIAEKLKAAETYKAFQNISVLEENSRQLIKEQLELATEHKTLERVLSSTRTLLKQVQSAKNPELGPEQLITSIRAHYQETTSGSSEQTREVLIGYNDFLEKTLSAKAQQINSNLHGIPEIYGKIDSLEQQRKALGRWPWQNRAVKKNLDAQIRENANEIKRLENENKQLPKQMIAQLQAKEKEYQQQLAGKNKQLAAKGKEIEATSKEIAQAQQVLSSEAKKHLKELSPIVAEVRDLKIAIPSTSPPTTVTSTVAAEKTTLTPQATEELKQDIRKLTSWIEQANKSWESGNRMLASERGIMLDATDKALSYLGNVKDELGLIDLKANLQIAADSFKDKVQTYETSTQMPSSSGYIANILATAQAEKVKTTSGSELTTAMAGATVGFVLGGPLGAAIGAGVSLLAQAVSKLFTESSATQAKVGGSPEPHTGTTNKPSDMSATRSTPQKPPVLTAPPSFKIPASMERPKFTSELFRSAPAIPKEVQPLQLLPVPKVGT